MAIYHTPWTNDVTLFKASSMNPALADLDKAIAYVKCLMIHCDGTLDYAGGVFSWSGTLRILFIGSDGVAYQNTIAASNISLSDNEFAYVDLVETNDTVLTMQKAAVTPGSASNFSAFNRIVFGYRNTASDEFFTVELVKGWTNPVSGAPVRNTTRQIFPEYAGAVLTKSGSANDAGTLGMTSDLEVISNVAKAYYEWASSLATGLQSYDVFIKWQVPHDFKAWQAGTNDALTLDIKTEENTTTNNKIDVTINKDGSATTSALSDQKSASAATWETIGFDDSDTVISSLAAGDILCIRIRLYSQNSKYARIGKIGFKLTLQ